MNNHKKSKLAQWCANHNRSVVNHQFLVAPILIWCDDMHFPAMMEESMSDEGKPAHHNEKARPAIMRKNGVLKMF